MKTVIFEALADISRAVRGIAFVAEFLKLVPAKIFGALTVPPSLPAEVGHYFLLEDVQQAVFPVKVP